MFFQRLSFLLDHAARRQYIILIFLSIVSSLLQTAGVGMISVFFTVLLGGALPRALQQVLGAVSMLELGSLTFMVTLTGTVSSAISTYWGTRVSWSQYPRIASRLLKQYLDNSYEWHLSQSPSALAKTVITEVHNIVNGALQQCVMVVVRGFEAFFLVTMLIAVRPLVAVCAVLTFGTIYGALFVLKKGHIRELGRTVVTSATKRHQTTNEALSGIKAVKVSGNEAYFIDRFRSSAEELSLATAQIQYFTLMPKYFIETALFGGLIGFVVLSSLRGWETDESIPLLALYGAAAIRLLPAAQQLYSSLASLTASRIALENVSEGIQERSTTKKLESPYIPTNKMSTTSVIELDRVSYSYPGTEKEIIKSVSLSINRGEKVGIVGATGAGKTTLVDLMLGLLSPTSGRVQQVKQHNRFAAYVPQSISFIDETIAANIALGEESSAWDLVRLENAAQRAEIHELITTLPHGYATRIGEQGVRLSGGQKQRIAIARALYTDPSILILDEASNALDPETERSVLESLYRQADVTMLVIAHRISILRGCQRILVIEDGEISGDGSFSELGRTHVGFRRLVEADLGN